MPIAKESALEALERVTAPGSGESVVALKWVRGIEVEGERVAFKLEVPGPLTPARRRLPAACEEALTQAGAGSVDVDLASRIPAAFVHEGGEGGFAPGVKNFVAVGSGKGGVGKSTFAANLACGLARAGARTGILDVDIYGPSIPLLFGVTRDAFMEEITLLHQQGKAGPDPERPMLMPYRKYGVDTMSLGYLIEEDQATIWRGPMVHGAIQQLLRDCQWGELDYLVLDLPPGTGDAQLTLSQSIPLAGAMIVCTPQPVALADGRKALRMFRTTKTTCLGLVENMTGPIFGEGGGRDAAEEWDIPFLGSLPLDPSVRVSGDEGKPLLAREDAEGPLVDALWQLIDRLTVVLAGKAKARPRSLPVSRS